jgi:hypothetical protein
MWQNKNNGSQVQQHQETYLDHRAIQNPSNVTTHQVS